MGGILRGAGRPLVGSIFNFIGYYLEGFPCLFIFGYVLQLQIPGVWIGFNFGLFVICLGCAIFIYRINWEKESMKARIRAEVSPVQKEHTSVFEDTSQSSYEKNEKVLN